jgi:Fe-S cluster biogenesis protein NfuA/nitrite reductase/ring-hydroxylating ferredoxin subunit
VEDAEARDRVARVETLLEQVEAVPDPVARDRATELAQALLDLYGAGLERIVERVAERDEGELADAFAGDELISHLLMLHDLHPVPLEVRVRGALDEVRPYLESHGGNVELLSTDEGVVHLRLEGSCSGCPSSTVTLKLAIEEAIHKAAPDVQAIEAEGTVEPATNGSAEPPLLQIEIADPLKKKRAETWTDVAGPELGSGETALREVGGERILFIRLERGVYAYRPRCPACGESLEDAALADGQLACAGCATGYDVRLAGRSLDGADLQLLPVPLLHDANGSVRVALGAPA